MEDYYSQVMTDDLGAYLIIRVDDIAIRRAGAEDVVIGPSLSDWFWDRVAAFGGTDPRPQARPDEAPPTTGITPVQVPGRTPSQDPAQDPA